MEIHAHTPTSPTLQQALKTSLPYSLPLHARIHHPSISKNAHILATYSPTASEVPECWAAAYYDHSMRPETELWIFASGEIPGHASHSTDNPSSLETHGNHLESGLELNHKFCPTCKTAILSLLSHISTLPHPGMASDPANTLALSRAQAHALQYPETGEGVKYPSEPDAYLRHLLYPSVVTLGTCHADIVKQVILDAGLIRSEFPGLGGEINKYLFKIDELPTAKELPRELRWGKMREGDMAVVQSRTDIPRAASTLLSMKSVGVFDERDMPVAWAFLGLDGSLTTMHTEPKYRGKGIAKAVAVKVFKEHGYDLAVDEQGTTWAHADVYGGNKESEAVCKSLGGVPSWNIYWVRIDLARTGTLVGK